MLFSSRFEFPPRKRKLFGTPKKAMGRMEKIELAQAKWKWKRNRDESTSSYSISLAGISLRCHSHPSSPHITAAGYTSSVVVKQKNVVNVNISLNLIGRLELDCALKRCQPSNTVAVAVATQLIKWIFRVQCEEDKLLEAVAGIARRSRNAHRKHIKFTVAAPQLIRDTNKLRKFQLMNTFKWIRLRYYSPPYRCLENGN